jgi:sugar (pentulose or hexulose) kinase
MKHVAVIDIGKTNAKVAIVDLSTLIEIAIRKTPNMVLTGGLYPHADVEALWNFILESLKTLNSEHGIDAITVTTHGATAALLNGHGELALPVLDYEFSGPDELAEGYISVRPDFSETGSPRLPIGLNLGAQVYWQQQKFSEAFSKATRLLMYPQYWSYRLSGAAASEVTSLGCHTDLWSPQSSSYSKLVERCGWMPLMAPMHKASDALGPILPEIAQHTGLDPKTPIYCGIHDSNASLVPYLLHRTSPCAVVSTGTWVIAMALGSKVPTLEAARDALLNVNAFGQPVPSARFMGGREFQTIMAEQSAKVHESDIQNVIQAGAMLLPSVVEGSGPFPDHKFRWLNAENLTVAERQVAVSYYLGLMTTTCLDLIGAEGDIIVEGPLSSNELFLDMLATATQRSIFTGSSAVTGTTIGAAMLVGARVEQSNLQHQCNNNQAALKNYAKIWRLNIVDVKVA